MSSSPGAPRSARSAAATTTRPTSSTTWRVARRRRSCRWTLRKRSGNCRTARDGCSCCTISRGTGTKRSPTCWGSCPARRNRSCITPAWRSAGISSAEGAGTMKDQWTDRLSEYLDGELAAPERTTLEAHLASCDGCRTTLDELRRVVTNARALDDRPPTADLWPAVAARIGLASRARPVARRFSFTVPQLAAASVVLALLSGGGAWLIVRRRAISTPPVVISVPAPAPLSA